LITSGELFKFVHKRIFLYSITRVVASAYDKQSLGDVSKENLAALVWYYESILDLACD